MAKESQNSSTPSSDGVTCKGKKRQGSRKAKGGQAGHVGHTLEMVQTPDQVVIHRPSHCQACQCELGAVAGQLTERRHIHELPVLRVGVTEHPVEALRCPQCPHHTVGSFPRGVQAPTQQGPGVRALAVSVSQSQLLPMERLGEIVADLLSCPFREGTGAHWIQEAPRT